jgi:Cys-tRNA synthase (O-phospho-L-seryl-tRNA:Cys-tRNA synthase)
MKKKLKDLVRGDKIRIIAEARHNKNAYYNQFKIGDIYVLEGYYNSYVQTICNKRISIITDSDYDIECEHYDEIEDNYEIY